MAPRRARTLSRTSRRRPAGLPSRPGRTHLARSGVSRTRRTPCARGTQRDPSPPGGAAPRGSDCGPRRLRHLPWDAGGEGPRHVLLNQNNMSRVTSVISVLSPPQVPESGRTCGARCPIAAVVRAVRAPAAGAGHGGCVGVPPRPAGLACADASGARVAGRPLACATTGPWTCPGAHAGREHPVPRASFLAEPRCLPVVVLASGPAHPAWFPGRHWSHHLCHACLSSHKTERDEQCPHLTGTGIVEVCYRLVIGH